MQWFTVLLAVLLTTIGRKSNFVVESERESDIMAGSAGKRAASILLDYKDMIADGVVELTKDVSFNALDEEADLTGDQKKDSEARSMHMAKPKGTEKELPEVEDSDVQDILNKIANRKAQLAHYVK